jgi:hypothetical protein
MDTAGADERLNQIFEHHYNDVLAYCSRRIGRSDADDVRQAMVVRDRPLGPCQPLAVPSAMGPSP